jgi:DNA-binding PadR family transcriptional regulator
MEMNTMRHRMHMHFDEPGWGDDDRRCRLMRGGKGRGHGGHGRGHEGHGRHDRHEHGRHGRRGLGGGGRFFDHGALRHVVLALLNEQPRHGYDIIRAIDERTGGAYAPSPGVIYPTLQLLQDIGHVTQAQADDGTSRNVFRITPEGRAFVEENGAVIGDIMARMQHAGRSHPKAFPAVVAAMDNLKSALRSGHEPWTEAQARDVAAAIDAAADRIRTVRSEKQA